MQENYWPVCLDILPAVGDWFWQNEQVELTAVITWHVRQNEMTERFARENAGRLWEKVRANLDASQLLSIQKQAERCAIAEIVDLALANL
jgi:hypothetical protein